MFTIQKTTHNTTEYLLSFDNSYNATTTTNQLEALTLHSRKQAERIYYKLKYSNSHSSEYSIVEISEIPDEKNTNFIFSTTNTDLLMMIANLDIDAIKMAKVELQKRGYSIQL